MLGIKKRYENGLSRLAVTEDTVREMEVQCGVSLLGLDEEEAKECVCDGGRGLCLCMYVCLLEYMYGCMSVRIMSVCEVPIIFFDWLCLILARIDGCAAETERLVARVGKDGQGEWGFDEAD